MSVSPHEWLPVLQLLHRYGEVAAACTFKRCMPGSSLPSSQTACTHHLTCTSPCRQCQHVHVSHRGDMPRTGCSARTLAGPVCRCLHRPCLHCTLWPVPCPCLTQTAGALAAVPKPYQPPFGLDEPDKAVGARCKLFWPDDNEWYEGVIRAYSWDMGKHNVWYFYDEQVSVPEGLALC